MSANSKKSLGGTTLLILLGMAVLIAGAKWLMVLIPAAVLVWYAAKPTTWNWPELTEGLKMELDRLR